MRTSDHRLFTKTTVPAAVLLAVSLLAAVLAFAADTTKPAKPAEKISTTPIGDVKNGEKLSATCSACHGSKGQSTIPSFPKLAGQNARYLIKQLQDMKSGARKVAQMAGISENLSDKDIQDLASYYAAQKPTFETAKADLLEPGQKLFRGGVVENQVAACIACHGPKGEGVAAAGFPALAGQHAAYIESQLKAYRNAARGDKTGDIRDNDGSAKIMRSVAKGLTDDEIKAVSSYLSGLYY